MTLAQPDIPGESRRVVDVIEQCRQKQEEYLIKKNEEPVQLSLFRLETKCDQDQTLLEQSN